MQRLLVLPVRRKVCGGAAGRRTAVEGAEEEVFRGRRRRGGEGEQRRDQVEPCARRERALASATSYEQLPFTYLPSCTSARPPFPSLPRSSRSCPQGARSRCSAARASSAGPGRSGRTRRAGLPIAIQYTSSVRCGAGRKGERQGQLREARRQSTPCRLGGRGGGGPLQDSPLSVSITCA